MSELESGNTFWNLPPNPIPVLINILDPCTQVYFQCQARVWHPHKESEVPPSAKNLSPRWKGSVQTSALATIGNGPNMFSAKGKANLGNARLFIILSVRNFGGFVRNFGWVFAILLRPFRRKFKRKSLILLVGREGVNRHEIVNKMFVNRLAFPKIWRKSRKS